MPYRVALWALAIAVDLLTPVVAGARASGIPPHVAHVPERFGLFTIIVLGEAVVATVQAITPKELHPQAGITAILGLVLSFALWWDYFDGVRGAKVREIQNPAQGSLFRKWMYLHLPLAMSIPIIAIGVEHAIQVPPGETVHGIGLGPLLGSSDLHHDAKPSSG